MPARTSSAVATLALRCFPGCRYHAFSGNEIHRRSHEHRSRPRPCLPQEPAGIGQQGPERRQHFRLAQGRRQAEGRAAHSPAREPRLRTVRHPRHLYDALQGRHQTRNLFRISRGRPNLLDLIHDKEVQWIVNTSETGAEAMVDECQRSEESENMLAYSHLTSKETVRKAYKSRCAPRPSCPASPSPRPSPPSPPPSKAWKTGWPLIQDVTRPQRPASRTATQSRLPCLRSQGTSTTSEDSRFAASKSTIDT